MIPRGEVQVWDAILFGVGPDVRARVSGDEQARADRFRAEHARDVFLAGRGLLRTLIAHQVGSPPQALRLDEGPHGKPFLREPLSNLRFSVSHSGDQLLLAFASARDVGVDIERVRPHVDLMGIAQRYFAPAELEALTAASQDARPAAFYSLWTRKEALLKARGQGIAGGLGRAEADFLPLTVRPLAVARGYAAAVAAEGDDWTLVTRQWPSEAHVFA
jgi:4'-phosphopantetheinyl transferase